MKMAGKNRGITLVEVLLTLAIAGILLSFAYSFQIFGLRNFFMGVSQADMQQTARMIDEVIRNHSQIRNAVKIGVGNKQLFIENGKLYFGEVSDARHLVLNTPELIEVEFSPDGEESKFINYTITVGSYSLSNRILLNNTEYEETALINLTNDPFLYSIPVKEEVSDFAKFIIDNNVFVFGEELSFYGDNVIGSNATIFVKGNLDRFDLNDGCSLNVTNIIIDGSVDLDNGSAGLGSETNPGKININGDLTLWNGSRNIYGDVYVNGDFRLKDARIHGRVFVDGDLELGHTPYLAPDARIFYTGSIQYPNSYDQSILDKCIHQDSVPAAEIPNQTIPAIKDAEWFTSRGYTAGGDLTSDMMVFAESYSSSGWKPTAENVIIVASKGDISITGLGGSGLTGVLYAPKGRIIISGGFFEGLAISKDGFHVTSGGTNVTFKSIDHFISDPNDYPF